MNVTQRNENAKQFILDKLELVSTLTESYFEQLDDYLLLKSTLNSLINVSAKGFRGVVATNTSDSFYNQLFLKD